MTDVFIGILSNFVEFCSTDVFYLVCSVYLCFMQKCVLNNTSVIRVRIVAV